MFGDLFALSIGRRLVLKSGYIYLCFGNVN